MNIKEHIQNKGFTISQVASLMTNKSGEKGITQSSLSQIINGNPSLDKLKEISNIIGISVSELLRDENSNINGYIELNGTIHKVNSTNDLKKVLELANLEEEKKLNILPKTE